MRMFITSKNKYLSNDMKIFGTCSISLNMAIQTECKQLIRSTCIIPVASHTCTCNGQCTNESIPKFDFLVHW